MEQSEPVAYIPAGPGKRRTQSELLSLLVYDHEFWFRATKS